jgi:hypothetical protein
LPFDQTDDAAAGAARTKEAAEATRRMRGRSWRRAVKGDGSSALVTAG